MVGGGAGADIGRVHQWALRLDDRYELVAGVFGRDPERASATAASLGVAPERAYAGHEEMAAAEAARPDGIDVAVVATPNDTHFPIAHAFLSRGIPVVCEKPLTGDAASSAELVEVARAHDALLAVSHCYSAYAMVREAGRLVRDGRLGAVRYVEVEHASGWAAARLDHEQAGGANWRTDPAVGGTSSVVADLGTHAYHLVRYVTGLDAVEVSAQLHTLVPGRAVFDNATVALRLSGSVPGRLWASMAATGHPHGLRLRVFGDLASIEWRHEDPHHLVVRDLDATCTTLSQGMASLSPDAARVTRTGLGHPEGFLEAFANFYGDVADELVARRDGLPSPERELSFPTGTDGLMGVQLVEAVTASHQRDGAWTPVHTTMSPTPGAPLVTRIALLGAGFIGSVHAANLAASPRVDFTHVYDVDAGRAAAVAQAHGAQVAAEVDAVFDPSVVDAVLVASSTDTHSEHVRRAADAGVAVLCEKPIDLDLAEATETVRYATERGLRAMVGFNRRFDADYAELKRIVDAGEVGDVELVQMSSRGPSLPPLSYLAVSGGQMRDQTVHFFDLARWLTGLDPVEVYAAGSALADPRLADLPDVDTSVVVLRLPGGGLVQIDSTRRTGYGYDERIEVLGSTGMAEARRQRTGSVSRYAAGRVVEDGLHPGWFERVRPTYAAALEHFVDALAGDAPIAPSLADGLRAQAIAEAATRSLASGRAEPVEG